MYRISFSRAETALLNSWSPNQQTVYHILRHIMKKASFIESEQSEMWNIQQLSSEDIDAVVL